MSLQLIYAAKSRLVLCSDSLGVEEDTGALLDNFPKLFMSGAQTAVGFVGLMNVGFKDFVAPRIELISERPDCVGDPHKLVDAIAEEMSHPIQRALQEKRIPDDHLVFGAFAIRRQPGGIYDFSEFAYPTALSEAGCRVLGNPRIERILENKTIAGMFYCVGAAVSKEWAVRRMNPNGLSDRELLAAIDAVVHHTRQSNPEQAKTIGDMVDVVVIDDSGARWLRHKSE